jgi:hypothetical protein
MSKQEELIRSFKTTHWLITKFAEGLTHKESITLPPFKANSFNWVLGHILVGRDRVLALLGQKTVLEAGEAKLYETGSEPVSASTAVTLERLLDALSESQTSLGEGLVAASQQAMNKLYGEEQEQTVGSRIAGEHWHETYHVGQLEILRQVSGEREAFP